MGSRPSRRAALPRSNSALAFSTGGRSFSSSIDGLLLDNSVIGRCKSKSVRTLAWASKHPLSPRGMLSLKREGIQTHPHEEDGEGREGYEQGQAHRVIHPGVSPIERGFVSLSF